MDLELQFDGSVDDLVSAVVDVRVADLGVADAPADGPAATADLPVTPGGPSARVTVDLPSGSGMYEPGLLVRVRGRTADDDPVEFVNTSSTPVTHNGPVRVRLSRIA